ncbi:8301_t:CDS:1 [Paraglomus occultum]|uniref:8301_t:CDS:1 n=1 Tax=Paraglomus occultum TaxID=144539 RepID=A0A9N9C649_9GLOM|nr:8301_t:CDS:1 [Paraglomus occultum]
MNESNNINNYIGLYDNVYQPEDFDIATMSEPNDTNSDYTDHYNNIHQLEGDNTNNQIHLPITLHTQRYTHFRPATSFLLHNDVHINTINYDSTENLYQDPSYYQSQLNTSSHEQDINNFCPLCGSSDGQFGTISSQSIAYTFTPMRTQASFSFNNSTVMNEPTSTQYMVIKEVRIQLVLGRVPAVTGIGEMLGLTRM